MQVEPWIEQTIDSFGDSLGIPNALGATAMPITFCFERTGRVTIRNDADGMKILLSREIRYLTADQMRRALSLCHFNQRPKWPTAVGLATGISGEDNLFFSATIPRTEFSLTSLQQCFDYLSQLQDVTSGL